jgi:RimJ/RimL family protein N-acetyltransferase
MENQFIYRQERDAKFEATNFKSAYLLFFDNPFSALRISRLLMRALGLKHFLKLIVKLFTPTRMFYCVISQNKVASYGYVAVSRCKHYKIEKGAVVIGPVMTEEEFRGRGIATFALQSIMNELIFKGFRIFYIDTAETNFQMQRVIFKCGFGEPIERVSRTKGRFV